MNETILLVEDDSSVRQSAAMVLDRAGFEVSSVDDGRQALDLMARQRVDLVLLDVMLPGKDGFEVCREIRRTSRAGRQRRERAHPGGAARAGVGL